MRRAGRLGQSVDGADLEAETLLETGDRRRRDRRSAAVRGLQRRQRGRADARLSGQREVGRDRRRGHRRPVQFGQPRGLDRVEAVREHGRDRRREAEPDVGGEAGHVIERRDPEDHVGIVDLERHAVGLGRERDVAVGVDRALRRPGRPRRVREHRGVRGGEGPVRELVAAALRAPAPAGRAPAPRARRAAARQLTAARHRGRTRPCGRRTRPASPVSPRRRRRRAGRRARSARWRPRRRDGGRAHARAASGWRGP